MSSPSCAFHPWSWPPIPRRSGEKRAAIHSSEAERSKFAILPLSKISFLPPTSLGEILEQGSVARAKRIRCGRSYLRTAPPVLPSRSLSISMNYRCRQNLQAQPQSQSGQRLSQFSSCLLHRTRPTHLHICNTNLISRQISRDHRPVKNNCGSFASSESYSPKPIKESGVPCCKNASLLASTHAECGKLIDY